MVSLLVSLAAVATALAWSVTAPVAAFPGAAGSSPPRPVFATSSGAALAWSLPIAPFVFGTAIISILPLPARLPLEYDGPVLIGVSATLTLGTGIAVQTVARARGWGPRSGVAGALLAAVGYTLVALGGAQIGLPLFVVICAAMGLSYGLCLREGLLDLETLAPPERRGLLTGLFYVVTYIGFGLPLLLEVVRPLAGLTVPFVILAVVALAAALTRAVQLRAGHPAR